ncbi:hypothetical protein LTR17_016666 [Elasticomyces elasticus]|nr:hypothetical protein LTR17_016666 [Elasticomyces elasticus]
MSVGIGVSDLVKGVELALAIYRLGFVKENAADKRYHEFRESINDFQSLLGKLDRSLQRAHDRWVLRGPPLGLIPHDPLSKEFEQERKAIVGPFMSTLEECEELLEANKACRAATARHGSPKQNLLWHLSQQGKRVDELRARLLFHAEKIRFVIDRLELELLTDLDAKADDLSAMAEENLDKSAEILLELNRFRSSLFGFLNKQGTLEDGSVSKPRAANAAIAARFQHNSLINAPRPGEIPLADGFDALLSHFQQSVSSSDQTPEQFLLSLKIQWLLDHIKNSREYREARPGFYYKRAVNQIGRAVLARAPRPADLVLYDESVLMALPESCFGIWTPPSDIQTADEVEPDPRVPRPNEQQVAHVQLTFKSSHHGASVLILRKSNERFRLVRETIVSLPDQKIIVPLHIDASEDKMIPRYTLPTLKSTCLEISIFSRSEENLFKFPSLPDLHKFQTAFTGYKVAFDHAKTNIRCQFMDEAKGLGCLARIQIWQDPLVLPSGVDNSDVISASSSTCASQRSRSRQGSLVLSIPQTTNVTRTADGVQVELPKLSAIVMFTQLSIKKKTRFTLIFMELQEGVDIFPQECDCHVDYNKCPKLILGRPKSKLTLRLSQSDADASGRPDPNTFDVFPFRLPRGSDFGKLPVRTTEYAVLQFDTLKEKRDFHDELIWRFKIRDKQLKDRRNLRDTIMHQHNHPERHDGLAAHHAAMSFALQESSSDLSLAPQLVLPDTGPALIDAFAAYPMPGMEGERPSNHTELGQLSPSTSTSTSSIDVPFSATTSHGSSPFSSPGSDPNLSRRPVRPTPQTTSTGTAIRNGIARLSFRGPRT